MLFLSKSMLVYRKTVCDCVMVLNQKSKDFVESMCCTKIQIIPNFVEGVEVENSHMIRDEVKRVLYVGGVIESKGCMDLIEVAKAFPHIEFRLVGNPELAIKAAEEMVPNVTLLGAQPHDIVHEELMCADVFAFLSYFPGEGFSNALVEAMACGLPCLVSDWAANADMIEKKGGEVVPIRDPHACIQALERMMPKEVRNKQSAFNLWKVQKAYVDSVVLDQYVDCYESIVKG